MLDLFSLTFSFLCNETIILHKHISATTLFLFVFNLFFIYLFLAVLGLRCCMWTFSSCGERGLLFVPERGLLIAVASLVGEHRL